MQELSTAQLEALDAIKGTEGYKVMLSLVKTMKDNLLQATFQATEMRITRGDKTMIDTLDRQVGYNSGFAQGLDWIMERIDKAHAIRQRVEEQKK